MCIVCSFVCVSVSCYVFPISLPVLRYPPPQGRRAGEDRAGGGKAQPQQAKPQGPHTREKAQPQEKDNEARGEKGRTRNFGV